MAKAGSAFNRSRSVCWAMLKVCLFSGIVSIAVENVAVVLIVAPIAFALAWIGHFIEGNKPAFFADPLQLLVGPVFFVREAVAWVAGRGGDACGGQSTVPERVGRREAGPWGPSLL